MPAKPNYDPAIENDLPAMIKKLFWFFSLKLQCFTPAVVVAYDRKSNLVTAQPAINTVFTDGSVKQKSPVIIPCFNPCASNIGINFPLKKGDTGWIIAADRDTTFFKQYKTVASPNTKNFHRYDFGIFIPDAVSGFVISENDAEAMVIQTMDGTTKISIKAGEININSTANVIVNSPASTVNGDLTVNGNINTTGTLTADTDVVSKSVSLTSHTHKLGNSSTTPPEQ